MHNTRPGFVGPKRLDSASVSRHNCFANTSGECIMGTCTRPARSFAIVHGTSSSGFLRDKSFNIAGNGGNRELTMVLGSADIAGARDDINTMRAVEKNIVLRVERMMKTPL